MRDLFSRPHPWIMQALGGLLALIISAPLVTWMVVSVLNAKAPATVTPLAPPPSGQAGGGQSTPAGNVPPPGGKTYTVKMQPSPSGTFVFSPATLTIHAGDTVHWVDVNTVPHNIVGLGSATSLIVRTAVNTDPYTLTFTKAGTYHYECQVHLPGMVGVITVT